MKNLILCFLSMCLLASPLRAFAGSDFDLFNRLVDVQRDQNGQLVKLVLKAKASKPQATLAAAALTELQNISVRDAQMSADLEQMMSTWTADQQQALRAAHAKVLSKAELAAILQDNVLNDILVKLEATLNKVLVLNVLSAPNNPGFYEEHALINAAIKEALKLAATSGTAFGVAEFLINRTVGLIQEKRGFSQNILLYYFEKYPSSALGFTDKEVSLIKSSIYEARLSWQNIPGFEDAKQHWATYGQDHFAADQTKDAGRLQKYGSTYAQVYQNLNYAFTPVRDANSALIVNTHDQKSEVDKTLSIAYDGADPGSILKFRAALEVEQLGLGLVPMPSIARSTINSLINSFYGPQKQTEGSLYAALVITGHASEAQTVLEQTINPFLINTLK